MYGPALSGIVIALTVGVILLLTMHWWSRWVAIVYRRICLNVQIAGVALGDVVKRMTGQGATRPPGQSGERRSKREQ